MSRTYAVQTISTLVHAVLPIHASVRQSLVYSWDTCQYCNPLSGVSGGIYPVCPEDPGHPAIYPVCPEDPGHPAIYPVSVSGGSLTLYRSGGPRSPSGVCGGSQVTLRSTGGSHLAGVCVRGHPAISIRWVPGHPAISCRVRQPSVSAWCIQGDPACKSLICATKNISSVQKNY